MNASAPNLRRGFAAKASVIVLIAMLSSIALPSSIAQTRKTRPGVRPAATPEASPEAGSVRSESFTLRPGSEVRVDNSRGSTRVECWNSATARVVAEKKGGAPIDASEIVMMGAGNTLIIEARPAAQAARLDVTLYLPHGTQLAITGGAFPVDVSGSLSGADVETTSGAIGYRLPASDDAMVEARSGRGVIRSTVPLTDVSRDGTQSLRGQLGNGSAQIVLTSQSGNISLLPGASTGLARSAQPRDPAGTDATAGQTPAAESRNVESGSRDAEPVSSSSSSRSIPGSNRQSAGSRRSGTIDLGGADRGDDGSSSSRTGPFDRQQQQRSSSGGNSGLRARIIPSDDRPATSPRPSTSDPADDPDDPRPSAGRTGSQMPPDPVVSGGGSGGSVFAGVDAGDDGGSKTRGGPFERDRKSRNNIGGSSGLRVRIIPSPEPMKRVETITFPSQEQHRNSGYTSSGYNATASNHPPAENPRHEPATETREPRSQPSSAGVRRPDSPADSIYPRDAATQPAGTNSRTAPTLRRPGEVDAGAPEPASTGGTAEETDDDVVSLKAALVNLNVSVTNRTGLALGNLKKEEFHVAENGQNQSIQFFAPSTAPFNLVLLIDLSGSIKDKLDVIKNAALKFVDVLGSQDKIGVISFTDEIRVVSQLTSDRDELKRRIKSIEKPHGGTAFYEATWFALVDTLRETQGQRNAIVVLSDGVDSSMDRYNPLDSRVSFAQLTNRLEESDVMVFPIYLDTEYEEVFERGNSTSEAYAVARDQLERLADVSGGQMFKAEKASDLSGVYKQVAAALRTVYSIGYQPTNPTKDGTFRRIRVTVDRTDAAVRTRKGYYAK
jgi:VWFA-related protein